MIHNEERRAGMRAAALLILGMSVLGAAAAAATPESTIQKWPGFSRSEARVMIAKYGEPNAFDDGSLVWYKNGPWEKTVVRRRAPLGFLDIGKREILMQSIAYSVPNDKLEAVKRFDGHLTFDKAAGTLTSRSDREGANYLALNLASEIAAGKRSVKDARDFYRRTLKLSEAGKSSAYMDGFLFMRGSRSMPESMGQPNP